MARTMWVPRAQPTRRLAERVTPSGGHAACAAPPYRELMPIASVLRLAGFLTLVVATACSSSSSGSSSGAGAGGGGGTSSGTTAAGTASSGTCDSACTFYLACKTLDPASNQQLCVDACVSQGYTAAELVELEGMPCAEAVTAIESGRGGTTSGSSSGGSSSGGKDCFGCQHDGTSCIYIGPMGGYSQCDPSCC